MCRKQFNSKSHDTHTVGLNAWSGVSILFEGSVWGAICLVVSGVQILAFTSDYEDLSKKLKNLVFSLQIFQRSLPEIWAASNEFNEICCFCSYNQPLKMGGVSTYLSVGEEGKG